MQSAVLDDGTFVFKSCPINFITDHIHNWYTKYKITTKYNGVDYNSMSAREVEAMAYFDNVMAEYYHTYKKKAVKNG